MLASSVIIRGSTDSLKAIDDYQRISTLDQAEAYFSELRNIDDFQRQSACNLVLELFRNFQTLPDPEKIKAWRIKELLAYKNPQLFHSQFEGFATLPLPEGFEKKPSLTARLSPFPRLPPIPKKKIIQKIDSLDGFVIVEEDADRAALEKQLREMHERELKYQKEVMTLFLHDYGSHLFANPALRYLWQTQISINQQDWIEKMAEILAFPDPAPFTDEQKRLVLALLKGLEHYFRDLPHLIDRPQQVEAAEQAIHLASVLEGVISAVLEPHMKEPFRPFLAATLGHLSAEKLLEFLQPELLLLVINHIADIDFSLIVHDPEPPLEAFKAEDKDFSRRASESLYNVLMSLIGMIPVNSLEKTILEQAKDWLKEHKEELGETLQLSIERLLKTPGRLNITQGLFFLLWNVKDGSASPAFPNPQQGIELAQAPDLLEKKFVAFLHQTIRWQIDHAVSEKNIGIRLLAKAGKMISDKPIRSNLKKLGKILFKILNNKNLMLKLIECTAQEIRLSKNQ